jgi:hypothetical protein
MSLLDKLKGVFSKKEESGTKYNSENETGYTKKPTGTGYNQIGYDKKKDNGYDTKTEKIINSTGLENVAETENSEKAAEAVLAVVGILGGLYTLSPNLTGNAVSDMGLTTTNIFGAIILILGLIGLYLLFRKKKRAPARQLTVPKKRKALFRKKKKRR